MTFDGREFSKNLPDKPGVYRMVGENDLLLYVGKAKNLKNRVSSYFQKMHTDTRIVSMIAQIQKIDVIVVPTEADALILESRLIKQDNPKYNIALRDDRGYPYIHLSVQSVAPQISVQFGKKSKDGVFFGPYPSSERVYQSVEALQKHCKLRTCNDVFYASRSRPCLEYQIGRCSAPCVGKISLEDYQSSAKEAQLILEGKSDSVVKKLLEAMEQASQRLDFEQAAVLRDRIAALRHIQNRISVDTQEGDRDVFSLFTKDHIGCVTSVYVRDGKVIGTKNYRLDVPWDIPNDEIMENFLMRLLQDPLRPIPPCVIVPNGYNTEALSAAIGLLHPRFHIKSIDGDQDKDYSFVQIATETAQAFVETALSSTLLQQARVNDLVNLLNLPAVPQRIECYDISHTQGTDTVASCVVAGPKGAIKSGYRRYNITDITPGDDYAAMKQVLTRRFSKPEHLPDLLLIDGGIGQVAQAITVLSSFNINIPIVGISKGPERKAGEETLIIGTTGEELTPGPHSLALHYLQTIRDESHRFAIEGHRKKRLKRMTRSQLENIEGIGNSKRQALLAYFGGFSDIKNATEEQLAKVPGIGPKLATKIYTQLKQF